MNNIIWLASYPKSGNTWFRIFLSNLLREEKTPACINELERTPIASSRHMFDDAVGYGACDLSHEEIDRMRPLVYDYLSQNSDGIQFLKIHDAFTFIDACPRTPMVSYHASRGGIYIIRNPLDLVISFANHYTVSINDAVKKLNNDDFCLLGRIDGIHNQLRQRLLAWCGHVNSWVDAPGLDIHVMRYEDMKLDSLNTFSSAVQFCGLEKNRSQIQEALALSDFTELQRQENEKGFKEKPMNSPAFFNKGKVGYWRDTLTPDQADAIIDKHRDVMNRFGYLDRHGIPVY